MVTINIDEEIYQNSLQSCNLCLLGRFSSYNGKSTPKPYALHGLISPLLNIHGGWKPTPPGKGFFALQFSSLEDKFKALSFSAFKLPQGIFRFFQWSKDFNPSKPFPFAHVWIHIRGLPWEYWQPSIISFIAKVVGFPIRFAKETLDKSFGIFAKILVEVNLTKKFPSSVLVERNFFCFLVPFVEQLVTLYWFKKISPILVLLGLLLPEISITKPSFLVPHVGPKLPHHPLFLTEEFLMSPKK